MEIFIGIAIGLGSAYLGLGLSKLAALAEAKIASIEAATSHQVAVTAALPPVLPVVAKV
jgi:hypothetical protein